MNELLRAVLFLPPQASTYARNVDWLHYFIIITTFLGAAAVTLVGGYFVVRYRRSRTQPDNEPPRPDQAPRTPMAIEVGLIATVSVLFFVWWILGMILYTDMRVAPDNAMRIYATAKQWMWKFEYLQGQRSISTLYVPVGRPIELVMTSRDVLHSFYVPAFRTKMDLIPQRFTTTWFQVQTPGRYQILCAEYCGTGHSEMRGEVIALAPREFESWLERSSHRQQRAGPQQVNVVGGEASERGEPDRPMSEELSMAEQGKLVAARVGCLKCHTLDGSESDAPTWLGLYGSKVKLTNGESVVADDAYLTESMMDPNAKIVAGYSPKMPSFLGRLAAPDAAMLLELIRSLQYAPRPQGPVRVRAGQVQQPTPSSSVEGKQP